MKISYYLVASYCIFAVSGKPGGNITSIYQEEDDRARIIGGGPVHEGELKYQLSIRLLGKTHSCGASLVKVENVQVAITAAHCLIRRIPEQLKLIGGSVNRNRTDEHQQERQIVDFVTHPDFDLRQGPTNDIAILFFDKPFEENSFVGTIPLPKSGEESKGRVVLSGWGLYKTKLEQNEYGLSQSDVLNKVEVPVLEYSACKKSYSNLLDEFSDHFMCTGFMEEWSSLYKGACIGDSGGPVKSVEGEYLAGVISFGKGCQDIEHPAVNIKVSHFTDWIGAEVRKFKNGGSSEEESKEDSKRLRIRAHQIKGEEKDGIITE